MNTSHGDQTIVIGTNVLFGNTQYDACCFPVFSVITVTTETVTLPHDPDRSTV